jgi:hypothetical protein
VFIGLALLVAQSRELVGSSCGLHSMVRERLDHLVQPLGPFGQRVARNVAQRLAGLFNRFPPLRVDANSVLDCP